MLKKSPGPGEKGGKIMERGKTFVMSYSCGKDSTLALHKMLAAGHTPLALLVMFNPEAGRSYFHGADHALLARYAEALQIPLLPVDTAGETYHLSMEAALREAKAQGAPVSGKARPAARSPQEQAAGAPPASSEPRGR